MKKNIYNTTRQGYIQKRKTYSIKNNWHEIQVHSQHHTIVVMSKVQMCVCLDLIQVLYML